MEAVDIYPTLVEASAGVLVPHCPPSQALSRSTALCTEGFSLLPLVPMREPPALPLLSAAENVARGRPWARVAAHSQFPRACNPKHGAACEKGDHRVGVMGCK